MGENEARVLRCYDPTAPCIPMVTTSHGGRTSRVNSAGYPRARSQGGPHADLKKIRGFPY